MILGCDAAGFDEDGNEVVVHSVISDRGVARRRDARPAALDPVRAASPGTFAERVAVPRRNLVPKPPELSFAEAACLPTAWLTAYRMLFTRARRGAGRDRARAGRGRRRGDRADRARAARRALRVWATSRSEEKRARALELGADAAFEPGARLPERVDAVMETVGAATWEHSLKSLEAGRHARDLGRDERRRPARRADPRVLPAAVAWSARRWARATSSSGSCGCASSATCGR